VPLDRASISIDQRDFILVLDEGHFGDLKAIEVTPAKLTKTVSAFANADGGELYIGIDEDKQSGQRAWRGFGDPEAANGHVQAFEELFPLGNDFDYTFLEVAGEGGSGLVLKIDVKKTPDIKEASDGLPYVRRGAQNQAVNTPEKHKRLEYVKGLASFEADTLVGVARVIMPNTTANRVNEHAPLVRPDLTEARSAKRRVQPPS